jgi:precorrin-2/cobalt-factor-2 C20-methyltransferase
MKKVGKLTGVALGPGDPELITVKGLKALQKADVVYYPATELSDKGATSFSVRILDELNIDTPCEPLLIPMMGKDRQKHYQNAFDTICRSVEAGKDVVVVSEGDLLFYSTFGYIYALAVESGLDCDLVPGVPAFIAGGAMGKSAIVEGKQSLKVIARPQNYDQIEEALQENGTVVVMKMSVLKEWEQFLAKLNRRFLCVERVGPPQQFATSDIAEVSSRRIPYFSLIIFYGQE